MNEFIYAASQECWTKHGLEQEDFLPFVFRDANFEKATLTQIGAALAYGLRLDHFCDIQVVTMIKNGYVRKVLERMIEIRDEMIRKQG